MPDGKFVSYLRVSTSKQGRSGLGLEAQRQAVSEFLNGGSWELVAEFVEVESGRLASRPELNKALSLCRVHGAVLVVAKLDRLARNAHFLLGLRDAGVEFVACDIPSSNRLTVGIMAMVAEEEARLISTRTKQALAAAKARGVKLGKPNLKQWARLKGTSASARRRSRRALRLAYDLLGSIEYIRTYGLLTPSSILNELNSRGIPASRGGRWSTTQVQRVLDRLRLTTTLSDCRHVEVGGTSAT